MRIGWNRPEERDRLTILVMVGVRTEAHTTVRLLVMTFEQILVISDADAGHKQEKF